MEEEEEKCQLAQFEKLVEKVISNEIWEREFYANQMIFIFRKFFCENVRPTNSEAKNYFLGEKEIKGSSSSTVER